MIERVSFENFKVFKSNQTLDLKPITILIGKNNSGKSAVARLPVLVAGGLRGEPIGWSYKIGDDSNNALELGTDFIDLVYGRFAAGSVKIQLEGGGNRASFVINQEYGILEYKLNKEDVVVEDGQSFEGFLLNGQALAGLDLEVDYIGAIRIRPKPTYVLSSGVYDKIGIQGQNAYPILIRDFEGQKILLTKLGKWYKDNFEGWTLDVKREKLPAGTFYQIVITSDELEINIKQTGQGIHQVLPLIIRSFMPDKQPTLIIVEEPETHLHPAAHGALAQRFVESLADTNKRYLIETHSQNFVLRVRRLVAEGKLKPEDLALYYVDYEETKKASTLRRIMVDEQGNLPNDDWPAGIFNETTVEIKGIIQAQLRNK